MPNYVLIGGHAYQPGSAAAKKAQELFNAMPQQPATPTVPFPSTPAAGTAPANFPSYPTTPPATGTLTSSQVGGGPNLAGAPGLAGKGAYGLVPQVPNPISTAAGSIAGNQGNLANLGTLGTGTTQLSANLAQLPLQMNLPGYGGLIGSASQNIQSNLSGIVDPQEWSQLQQRAGERGGALGITPSSPNFSTSLLTALDQSIAGRQNLGQQELNAAVSRTPTGQPFNIAGFQLSPSDLQSAQYAANLMAAAPDPTQAAQANLDSLLKAIEAGKIQTGGVPGLPPSRMPTAPGMPQMPFNMPFFYGGSGGGAPSGGGYYGPTAPGAPSYTPPATGWSPFTQNLFSNELPIQDTAGMLTDPFNLGGYQMPVAYGSSPDGYSFAPNYDTSGGFLPTQDAPPYDPFDFGY